MRSGVPLRAIGLVVVLLCAAGVYYRSKQEDAPAPSPHRELLEQPVPRKQDLNDLAAQPPRRPTPVASAVVKQVAELRDRVLPLSLIPAPSQKLTFGRGRLAILSPTDVTVRRLPDLRVVSKAALTGGDALTELADNSLLLVSRDATWRLEDGKTKWTTVRRATFFPGSLLLGHRSKPDEFWIFDPSSSALYKYRTIPSDEPDFPLLGSVELTGFDRRGYALLKDGSFVHTTADGMRRFIGTAHKSPLKEESLPRETLRIFSARRLDRAWVATADGTLRLISLTNPVRVLQTVQLPGGIYDLDIADERIAVIRADQGQERSWQLCVFAVSGERRFCDSLPGDPASGEEEDWVARVVENKNLALSTHSPFVAVGGPSWLGVWNAETGKPVELPSDQSAPQ